MSNYTDIIERLKTATGPDRELDRIIQVRIVNGGTGAYKDEADWLAAASRENWNTALYTASIDAAVDLIKRMVPDARWRVEHISPFDFDFWATAGLPGRQEQSYARTAPAALLLAHFLALEAREAA